MITKKEARERFINLHSYMAAKKFAQDRGMEFPDYEGKVKTEFKCRKNGEQTIVSIFGPMLYFDGGEEIVEKIQNIETPKIRVQLNSEGGDLMAARSISAALNAHDAEVTTVNMGLAASAASIVFATGTNRIMAEGAVLMVHRVMSMFLAFGNREAMEESKKDLQDTIDLLDKLDTGLAKTYAKISNLSETQVKNYMDKETFFDADETMENGLSTSTEEPKKPRNKKKPNTIKDCAEEAAVLLQQLFNKNTS